MNLSLFGGSALTDGAIAVPKDRAEADMGTGIPVTYVPARNTVMLSLALAWAEVLGADDIFLGVNAVDYSGYPDCRPALPARLRAAGARGHQGRRRGRPAAHPRAAPATLQEGHRPAGDAPGRPVRHHADLLRPGPGRACGRCDACHLRRRGFEEAGVPDPTRYHRSRKEK